MGRWTREELEELGLDLAPERNSFTYAFPPPWYAKRNSVVGPLPTEGLWGDGVSVYIHLPFCRMICAFCSLHKKLAESDGEVTRYLAALEREIVSVQPLGLALHSLYLGGGTPTYHSEATLARLIERLASGFTFSNDVEVCVECAPDDARSHDDWTAYFAVLKQCNPPLTRVSVGVQSMDLATLKDMRRSTSSAAILNLIEAADTCGLAYNVDFLMGYPMKKRGVLDEADATISSIDELIGRGRRPPSVSIYQLWDAGSIPIARRRRPAVQPGEMLAAKELVQSELFGRGYRPGAGTSFIREERFVHKWTIHRCTEFRHLGFGSGSYSILPTSLVQRERDIGGYCDQMLESGSVMTMNRVHMLSTEHVRMRRVILGLRTSLPVPLFTPQSTLEEELLGKLTQLTRAGILCQLASNAVALSRDAFLLTNEISALLHPKSLSRRPTQ